MKYPIALVVAGALVFASRDVNADCTPPDDEPRAPCISCGNLEQNVERAHDLAWNAFLQSARMQTELRVNGATLVHLINPPHASPGVLYYTVIIEDPDFGRTDTESHSRAVEFLRSWTAAISNVARTLAGEWRYTESSSERTEDVVSQSISSGSSPYIMRLVDSKGNGVRGGTIRQPRLTGEQQPALVGPSDLFPDDRYANEACIAEDPRQTEATADGSDSGAGDYADNADHWGGWGNGYGELQPECRPDFSDPAGAGVVCAT